MNDKQIHDLLKLILNKLGGQQFNWHLEGSANLKIQGVDVSVGDLDITTDDEGIEIFRLALKKYIVRDFFSPKVGGLSLVCDIDGFEVEINSYGDRKVDMFDKTKKISWKNLSVSTLPLLYAKKFYQDINRPEKVELIEKYLD